MAGLMSLDAESPAWWGAVQSLWEAHAKQADWVGFLFWLVFGGCLSTP